ncbi:alpha-glucosidase [Dyadobacter jejuensis]|uniref:Alpha-glucosidase n=1 Tax=Dyadobacter jejuensis TaxID=1082580 RepID=A0A316B459_9BACT|nr:glycoside hydrolase family 97 protein [Dyadobacter jejuensis]PWJ57367.1 alpha-glucosidase [Dyadobacter jejuensis]
MNKYAIKFKTTHPGTLIRMIILFIGCMHNLYAYEVRSPNGNTSVHIENKEGIFYYSVHWKDSLVISPSELSILPNTRTKVTEVRRNSVKATWKPVWGQFSQITDHHQELILDLQLGGATAQLIARVYDHGVGFRFILENYEPGTKGNFYCEYNLAETDALYCPNGEKPPLGPLSLADLATTQIPPKLRMPILIETKRPYLSILESDLASAPGFEVIQLTYSASKSSLVASNKIELIDKKTITPWRVILINEKMGDLVTNTVPLNLASPLQLKDPSWIKPGKTLWDWRVHGFSTEGGFTYGIDTESYFRFIDFAAKKGIEYFLIDDSWYKKASKGHFEYSDQLDLPKVIEYAAKKGVELLLYYDRRHGEYGDEQLYSYYQSLGMKGIKYGFMGENVPFTREAIKASAENQLMIDFHDSPVPMTGVERTYPNAITREYCHAQQDSRKAFTPETFLRMAMINAIQGPLDMNNGNFDLTGINKGLRQKGPKELNSYISTVVAEAARTLIIHSGLVCIPDAPEAYEQKADLFEFIQNQPVGKWDESRVLHAKMDTYITTARRQGESWFVGSVHNQQGGTLEINLDFLQPNQEYQVTYYEDSPKTHGKTNPEAYQVRTGKVKNGAVVKAKMAPGGGHCMWIRPI